MTNSEFEKMKLGEDDLSLINTYKEGYARAQAEGNANLMDSYHRAVEQIRQANGFSGGNDGSGYIPVDIFNAPNVPRPEEYSSQWDNEINMYLNKLSNPKEYISPYSDKINSLVELIDKESEYKPKYQPYIDQGVDEMINITPYEYNPDKDPVFQRFLTNVKGSAKEAYDELIGGWSNLSGGYVASWAEQSAMQAMEHVNEMAQMEVEKFDDLAYKKYTYEVDNIFKKLGASIGAEQQSIDQFNAQNNIKMGLLKTLTQMDSIQYARFRDSVDDVKYLANLVMKLDDRDFERYKFTVDQSYKKYEAEMGQVLAEMDFKRNEWREAMERTELNGFVSNQDSLTLGLPTGTLSKSARDRVEAMEFYYIEQDKAFEVEMKKMAFKHEQDMQMMEIRNQYALDRINLSQSYEAEANEIKRAVLLENESIQQAYEKAKNISDMGSMLEGEGLSDTVINAKLSNMGNKDWKTITNYYSGIDNYVKGSEYESLSDSDKGKYWRKVTNEISDIANNNIWGKNSYIQAQFLLDKIGQNDEYKKAWYLEEKAKNNAIAKQSMTYNEDGTLRKSFMPKTIDELYFMMDSNRTNKRDIESMIRIINSTKPRFNDYSNSKTFESGSKKSIQNSIKKNAGNKSTESDSVILNSNNPINSALSYKNKGGKK